MTVRLTIFFVDVFVAVSSKRTVFLVLFVDRVPAVADGDFLSDDLITRVSSAVDRERTPNTSPSRRATFMIRCRTCMASSLSGCGRFSSRTPGRVNCRGDAGNDLALGAMIRPLFMISLTHGEDKGVITITTLLDYYGVLEERNNGKRSRAVQVRIAV